ncbi:hypothetical protein K8I61_08300, partial [bacterium]|nr:hypothetical protein [bacterium]
MRWIFPAVFFAAFFVLALPATDARAQDTPTPEPTEPPGADEGEITVTPDPEPGKKAFPKLTDSDATVALDFTDTDIKEIVKIMAEMTGQNFLVDKTVSGTVTIISPTKVTPRQAYDIFTSVLAVNGFTTVQVGKITKIIPIKDAQTAAINTNVSRLPRSNDEFITQLIPLNYIDSNDVATAFQAFVSADGSIFAYGPSNMVIVMDNSANIQRIMKILQRLDVAGAEQEVVVLPLRYASAEMLADVILELFEGEDGGGGSQVGAAQNLRDLRQRFAQRRQQLQRRGGPAAALGQSGSIESKESTKVLADMRTNSLIVKSSKVGIRQIQSLVTRLDTPLPGGEGKIHVVYLENANADELAMTLADLAG